MSKSDRLLDLIFREEERGRMDLARAGRRQW